MRIVWKYELKCNAIHDGQYPIILKDVPKGSRVLSVGVQDKSCWAWIEVDPDAPLSSKTLLCIGTGFGTVPENHRFIGTLINGAFVWHIYE